MAEVQQQQQWGFLEVSNGLVLEIKNLEDEPTLSIKHLPSINSQLFRLEQIGTSGSNFLIFAKDTPLVLSASKQKDVSFIRFLQLADAQKLMNEKLFNIQWSITNGFINGLIVNDENLHPDGKLILKPWSFSSFCSQNPTHNSIRFVSLGSTNSSYSLICGFQALVIEASAGIEGSHAIVCCRHNPVISSQQWQFNPIDNTIVSKSFPTMCLSVSIPTNEVVLSKKKTVAQEKAEESSSNTNQHWSIFGNLIKSQIGDLVLEIPDSCTPGSPIKVGRPQVGKLSQIWAFVPSF